MENIFVQYDEEEISKQLKGAQIESGSWEIHSLAYNYSLNNGLSFISKEEVEDFNYTQIQFLQKVSFRNQEAWVS